MAKATPKTEVMEKEVNTEVVETTVKPVDNTEELLKTLQESNKAKDEEMAQMKAMLLQMQSMLINNQANQSNQVNKDEYINIYKQIPVVSLYNGTLNLRMSAASSNGKVITFNKFGEVRNIVYNDISDLVTENYSFATRGYFYILDEKAIEELGLADYYKNILSKEVMETIIDNDKSTVSDLFKSMNLAQRESLVSILVNRMANGEQYDLNKISAISELYGKDLVTMANDFKFLMKQSQDVR